MEYEGDSDISCGWCTWGNPQRIGKGAGRGHIETIQITALLRLGLNTQKSPGDLRKLAVTQTSVRNHQLTLV